MPKLPFGDKGPVQVVWDYEGTPLVLNPTFGTVNFRTTDSISDVQEEEWGETPVDAVFTGTVVELEVPMARSTLQQLITLLEGVDSGAGGVAAFKAKSGCDMYENAKQIVLKPLCDNQPVADSKKWIRLYKCFPYRTFELGFDREGQRVHLVVFKVFVNQDSGYEGKLYDYVV